MTGTGDPAFVSRTYTDGMGRNIYTVKSASNGNFAITGRLVYDGTGKLVRKGQSSWASSGEIDRFVLHLEEKIRLLLNTIRLEESKKRFYHLRSVKLLLWS
ncbi:hypothetical protein LEP1GSC020_0579 [Leptospira interrogans serovar Grippotyphosa str. 2006006986]|nr:hypothetical protein LEP1GSC020_0579 [Leptospira interrogans serovar Grippotyphosa str. 2006006986]